LRVARSGGSTHGHTRHGLNTTGDDQALPAGTNLGGSDVYGLDTGAAVAVELNAWDLPVPAGAQRGGFGNATTLFTHRHDTTDQRIFHLSGVQRLALLQGLHEARQKIDWVDFVKAAIRATLAARGAQ